MAVVNLLWLQSKKGNALSNWRSVKKNRRMRATPNIIQTFNPTGQRHVELVPSPVYAMGIYIFVFSVCVSASNVVKVLSYTHVETDAQTAVSTCAMLLFAFLLTRLALTGLARLNGLRSLVGLTMRLATSTA